MRRTYVLALAAVGLAACGGDATETTAGETPESSAPDTSAVEASTLPLPVETTADATDTSFVTAPETLETTPVSIAPETSQPPIGDTGLSADSPVVQAAVSDLAARHGIDPGSIDVVSAEAMVWPDGSLDCPMVGVDYIQVQVEGAQVILSHGGVEYDYRIGDSRTVLCDGGIPI